MTYFDDDEERANCTKAGEAGHFLCGICPDCNTARFLCGHYLIEVTR